MSGDPYAGHAPYADEMPDGGREQVLDTGAKPMHTKDDTPNPDYPGDEGVKADADKPRTDLIPWDAVLGMAAVLGFGARKYGAWNWQGLSKSRLFGAAIRHAVAYWLGEDLDPETGMPHLDHAMCCLAMLRSRLHRGRDDRPEELVADELVGNAIMRMVERQAERAGQDDPFEVDVNATPHVHAGPAGNEARPALREAHRQLHASRVFADHAEWGDARSVVWGSW